jgi:hypothetical protein
MLREHFVEEVRRRDRDGDGLLSRSEFGGGREDFERIDRNRDGFVDAKDLMREALDRSESLREVVASPWSPVYDRLVALENPDNNDLVDAVRAGTTQMHADQVSQAAQSQKDTAQEAEPAADSEDLLLQFLSKHKDLKSLYQRLEALADRLGRTPRYTSVDAFA